MRYQNLKSFQKHLGSAAPHHLCKIYLVAIGDDFERAKVFDQIVGFLKTAPERLSGDKTSLKDCLDVLESGSLLGEPVVILDEVEKFSKKEIGFLSEHLKGAAGFVILGSRSKLATLFTEVEKEGVVLDLLEEKPWDREKRLGEHLLEKAKLAAKRLAPEVAPLLLERLGTDSALLESELDKLICFVGEREMIVRDDVLAISPMSKSSTLWQQAEEFIWERGEIPSMEEATFHGFIPALRSQFHLGLCLAICIEEKKPSDEWGRYLPKLWPKILEKRSSQAARLGSNYFRKGLEKLFEIECLSRSTTTRYAALLGILRAYIHAS